MKRRSVIIAVVVALLATGGWWFLLYTPKDEHLAQVEIEIDGLLAQQQQLRNEITQLRQVEADEENLRADLARLDDYIPHGPAQPSVIRQFQTSADAAAVEITSLTFGDPVAVVDAPARPGSDLTLAEIPVSMVVEGSYFQVVDFFRRLEVEIPRAVLVEAITMGEGADSFPQLATTWNGSVFAEVPIIAVPPPAAPPTADAGVGGDAPAETASSPTTPGDRT